MLVVVVGQVDYDCFQLENGARCMEDHKFKLDTVPMEPV